MPVPREVRENPVDRVPTRVVVVIHGQAHCFAAPAEGDEYTDEVTAVYIGNNGPAPMLCLPVILDQENAARRSAVFGAGGVLILNG